MDAFLQEWAVIGGQPLFAPLRTLDLFLKYSNLTVINCFFILTPLIPIERPSGFVCTSSGKIIRGLKSTYKRHGTLNLFAALNVARGAIQSKITTTKKRPDFQEFLDEVVAEVSVDREVHIIIDNYCTHKKNDDWLDAHPNVNFHFTPTSASWLNQVEIWFGIMSRKTLRGASFSSTEQLTQAIKDFVTAYNNNANPFVWRKREVKGSQLRNTIVNLCN